MITAIILAKNEDSNIVEVIKSTSFCSEVIVVDNESTDKTEVLAKKAGARVISIKGNDFSKLRNEGLKNAKHNWVLFVDADERVTKELANDIINAVKNNAKDAFYLRREDIFWNKKIHFGEVKEAWQKGILRLVKKGSGKWKGKVHETYIINGKTRTGILEHPVIHFSHKNVTDFLRKINKYSSIRAMELFKKKKKTDFLDIIVTPVAKFFYTFFVLQGFRDGAVGFVYSFMMSFHSFLVRSKIYLLNHPSRSES